MLKDNTRKAISSLIMLSLRGGKAVKTVKAAKEIFHTEWTEDDIQLTCSTLKSMERVIGLAKAGKTIRIKSTNSYILLLLKLPIFNLLYGWKKF